MKKALLVFALVVAVAFVAEGADWEYLGGTAMEQYVDVSNIKNVRPNIVRAWEKVIYSSNTKRRWFEGKEINYSIFLVEYDCSEGRHRALALTFYYTDGTNEANESSDPLLGKWAYITPESLAERSSKFVCDFER